MSEDKTLLLKNNIEDSEQNGILELPPGKQFHLFVSHSSDDAKTVKELHRNLTTRFGLKCFNYESDFKAGQTIEEGIRYGFRVSYKVLIMLSPMYLESNWCMAELNETLDKASKLQGKSLIIPVILRPIKKIPLNLKPYRCIHADDVEDLAAKIYDDFIFNALDDQEVEDPRRKNGFNLLDIPLKDPHVLGSFKDKLNVYSFPSLSGTEKLILNTSNVNVEDHYKAVQEKVNDFWFIRHYKVFGKRRIKIFYSVTVALIVILISIAFCLLAIVIGKNTRTVDATVISLVSTGLGLVTCIGLYLGNGMARISLERKLQKLILDVNMNYVYASNCMIVYKPAGLGNPCLSLIRYDVNPCMEYLKILLQRRSMMESEVKSLDIAKQKIECKLRELQVKGYLIKWESLPIQKPSDGNKHNILLNRQCLCQMIGEDIYPVITV